MATAQACICRLWTVPGLLHMHHKWVYVWFKPPTAQSCLLWSIWAVRTHQLVAVHELSYIKHFLAPKISSQPLVWGRSAVSLLDLMLIKHLPRTSSYTISVHFLLKRKYFTLFRYLCASKLTSINKRNFATLRWQNLIGHKVSLIDNKTTNSILKKKNNQKMGTQENLNLQQCIPHPPITKSMLSDRSHLCIANSPLHFPLPVLESKSLLYQFKVLTIPEKQLTHWEIQMYAANLSGSSFRALVTDLQ